MERTENLGAVLMAVAAIQFVVFSIGIMRRSYLAVALPVFAALAAVSGLIFWVGYAMANAEPELAELDRDVEAA